MATCPTDGASDSTLSVPLHPTVSAGLRRDQVHKAELTIEEFIELL